MKKIIVILCFIAMAFISHAQTTHTYSDSAINPQIIQGPSADTTYLLVNFLVVESPNKYGIAKQAAIIYAYPASQAFTDNQKLAAIKVLVDAWVQQNYPAW